MTMHTEPEALFYRSLISHGDLVFDIGGHKGDRTHLFDQLGARVIVVEPQSALVSHLRDRFGNRQNVRVLSNALGDRVGECKLHICEEATTISTLSEHWKEGRFSEYHWNRSETVQVTTLDRLITEWGKPQFIKIDVEGFEYSVLRGLSSPVPLLSFEFTKEFVHHAEWCISYLSKLGPYRFNLGEGEHTTMLYTRWMTGNDIVRHITSTCSDDYWGDVYAHLV
jgi:FkbM family methyltransferase